MKLNGVETPRGDVTRVEADRRSRRVAQLERFRRSAAAFLLAAHGISRIVGIELLWKLDQPGLLKYADTVPAPRHVPISLPNLLLNPQIGWLGVIFDGLVLGAVLVTLLRSSEDSTINPSRGRGRARGWLHRG